MGLAGGPQPAADECRPTISPRSQPVNTHQSRIPAAGAPGRRRHARARAGRAGPPQRGNVRLAANRLARGCRHAVRVGQSARLHLAGGTGRRRRDGRVGSSRASRPRFCAASVGRRTRSPSATRFRRPAIRPAIRSGKVYCSPPCNARTPRCMTVRRSLCALTASGTTPAAAADGIAGVWVTLLDMGAMQGYLKWRGVCRSRSAAPRRRPPSTKRR